MLPSDIPVPLGSVEVKLQATLVEHATIVEMIFDVDTNTPEDCNALFDQYADGFFLIERCSWTGLRLLRVYLEWDCNFQIGDEIVLHHHLLTTIDGVKIYAVATIECYEDIFPAAYITGPGRTGNCVEENLSAEISEGSALRPFHYDWWEHDGLIDPNCFHDDSIVHLAESCYLGNQFEIELLIFR